MNRTSWFLSAAALLIAAGAGCQAIANLETRTYDPQATGCSLPSTGDARVRLVNVANVAGNTDFCIKPSGSSDWGRPVFRDGGNDALCLGTKTQPGGLAYAQATIPFAEPVGKIDVKAIPAGQTCSEKGTSEKDGIAIADASTGAGSVMTLFRYGGGSTPEAISALPEDSANTVASYLGEPIVRVVNALSGDKPIIFGATAGPSLPTSVVSILGGTPIPPGQAPPALAKGATAPGGGTDAIGAIDSNGYQALLDVAFDLGVAYPDGTTSPKALAVVDTNTADDGTFFAIGDPGDTTNHFALRGLYCQDTKSQLQGAGVDAGADSGSSASAMADQGLFEDCTFTALPSVSLDVVNISLYGAAAPYQTERRPIIFKDLAARGSQIMCIFEADDIADRNAIVTGGVGTPASPGQYPYSYMVTSSPSTPPTLAGDVKPAPTSAPCAAVSPTSLVTNVYTAVEGQCSTTPGGDPNGAGFMVSASCLSSGAPYAAFAHIYTGVTSASTPAELANDKCFACMIFNFTTSNETIATGQQNCTQTVAQPFAFAGQTPSLILSHYPLKNQDVYYLPSTGYRRQVLKSTVQLEDQDIDVFCIQLDSPIIDADVPYLGSYGSDVASDGGIGNGWEEEQGKQAREALAYIQATTTKDGLPAIIAGDFHSDVGSGSASDAGLSPVAPEVFNTFASAPGFVLAAPADPNYVEPCDYCPAPENPYNSSTPPYEFLHAFTTGFPENATISATLWGNTPEVTIPPNEAYQPWATGGQGPLMEYFGHNYVVRRP